LTDATRELIADLRARIALLERAIAELTARPKPQPTVDELYPQGIVDFTGSVSGPALPSHRTTISGPTSLLELARLSREVLRP
jgi:hypothetical protein